MEYKVRCKINFLRYLDHYHDFLLVKQFSINLCQKPQVTSLKKLKGCNVKMTLSSFYGSSIIQSSPQRLDEIDGKESCVSKVAWFIHRKFRCCVLDKLNNEIENSNESGNQNETSLERKVYWIHWIEYQKAKYWFIKILDTIINEQIWSKSDQSLKESRTI